MGTCIVSIGLSLEHEPTLSDLLLGPGIALWVSLSAIFLARLAWQRPRWLEEARSPGSLTAAAGTAVLGARLTLLGEGWVGYFLLALALCFWLGVIHPVHAGWVTPTVGISFVVTVATESLAVLGALLATERNVAWLAWAALGPLALGLVVYLYAFARIDLRQLLVGRGDQWIFGGALAIATLACAYTTEALATTSAFASLHGGLQDATLALWSAAACWLPALLAGELVRLRPDYDVLRWSTVFPLGMYAVSSIAAGSVTGVAGLASFGRVWIWLALAVWAAAFAGMLRRGLRLLRS
ncbi:MAG: tellurite resistance/C4-dicarboxylate transporter family protein [Gaiellaceae bacterium]